MHASILFCKVFVAVAGQNTFRTIEALPLDKLPTKATFMKRELVAIWSKFSTSKGGRGLLFITK
jgi:hypothetical protein